jgi:hypothetical protein
VTGQPIGLDHVLEEIAAEQGPWPKRSQAPEIGGISQISFDINPRQLTHIDVDDLDIPGAQREEHLILDPGLDTFAHFDRAAAKVEQRREALWRECIQRAAEPARLGFEHRCLALRNAPRCLNIASLSKRQMARASRRILPMSDTEHPSRNQYRVSDRCAVVGD